MTKPRIPILTMGGTIVSSGTSAGQMTGYTHRNIEVDDIVDAVPLLKEIADCTVVPARSIPSSCVTTRDWIVLARAVEKQAASPDVAGIVITHGTDTMEETAFFLNLVLKTEKSVVLTGAMRPATAISADGPLNLLNAVRVAANPDSCGRGVMIAMNGVIGSARDTSKTNTLAVDTFKGRDFGMLGFVVGDQIEFLTRTDRPHTVSSEFSIEDFGEDERVPRVDLVLAHANDDGVFVDASVAAGAGGIVYVGTGNGTVSRKAEESLVKAAQQGILVVRASRTGSGPVLDGQQRWQDAGFISSRTLNPPKSAILLQLVIAKYGQSLSEARRVFRQY